MVTAMIRGELKALADEGTIKAGEVSKAIKLYQINPDKPNPATV